jgi:hypothetical protein
MRASEILSHLRRHPFVPIRIFVSDGASYDVCHPAMAAVSHLELVIGLPPFDEDVPDRFAYCDPIHVTRIEPLDGSKPRRRAGKRK